MEGDTVKLQTSDVTLFTPCEVAIHNKPDDLWVSYLKHVFDLTPLVKEFEGQDVIKPILAFAGKDISEWFNPENGEVCTEDTLYQIQQRFQYLNDHIVSYTWKFEGQVLDMNLTLDENGIPDEREEFNDLLLPENLYIPAIMVYSNDDLSEA